MTQCLLVDEDRAGRRELSVLLGDFGFDLAETGDADTALKACSASPPDVVVMSDRIGGMESADFVRMVRKANRHKIPLVLMCAGELGTDEISRIILEGADECLVKPFDRELLAFKLRQIGLI